MKAKYVLGLFLVLGVITNGGTASGSPGEGRQRDFTSPPTAERVVIEGRVECRSGNPHSHDQCDLAVVDAKTGDQYPVVAPPSLLEEVCEDGGHVMGRVTGMLSPASLFSEQKLSVERFTVFEHSPVVGE